MTTDKAITTLNILTRNGLFIGDYHYLVYHLRNGNAHLFDTETWLLIADWIEGGCKKLSGPGRPKTGRKPDTKGRYREIKREYKKLLRVGKTQIEALQILSGQYGRGTDTIDNIVTHRL